MMKHILIIFVAVLILAGCSDANEYPEQTDELAETSIEKQCKDWGIAPKNVGQITELTMYADSISYKIVGGKMGHDSWFAKFTPTGEEIFSYVVKAADGKKKNAHINQNSIVQLSDNKLFLLTFFIDEDDPYTILDNYNSILSVIDFTSGEELSRLPVEQQVHRYDILLTNNIYYVLSGRGIYQQISCVSSNGTLAWSRETTESEKDNGLRAYNIYQALDDELMLFFPPVRVVDNEYDARIRIIDLSSYTLELEIPCGNIPHPGIPRSPYRFHRAEKLSDVVNVYFGEYSEIKVIDDELTNEYHIEYILENEFYYSIEYPTGKIIGKFMCEST